MNHPQEYTALVRPIQEGEETLFKAVLKEFGLSIVGIGRTPAQALSKVYKEAAGLIAEMVEDGESVPLPQAREPWEGYSGKATVRMPRSLHYKLNMLAEEENCSLNTAMVSILAWGAERLHCHCSVCGVEKTVIYSN